MSFDRRTVRTRDGRVIGVIPTPAGPDWDGNFGMPRYEECILCGRDTSGETDVLGVCFPDPADPDRASLAICQDKLLIVHAVCWRSLHRQMAVISN